MSADSPRRDVIVAEYLYRHEAEFAAGFLADAGIPYRLEADDAGGIDAGVTMSRPARLWVRREDAADARELLEVTPDALLGEGDDDDPPARGTFIESPPTASAKLPGGADATAARSRPAIQPVDAGRGHGQRGVSGLSGAERAVAGTLGAAFVALAAGFWDTLSGGPGGVAWAVVVLALGVVLVASAAVGRTWGPLRVFLRALSGVAP